MLGKSEEQMRAEIIQALDAHALSVSWLAARANLPKQNVHNWLMKGTKPSDPSIWSKLLAALPISDVGRPAIPVNYAPVPMRFAGIVPAGDWGDPLESEEFVEVESKFAHPRRFAATVVGDSCYPALRQGDLTIWHADPNPAYGVIVLAQRLSDNACTVKELQYDADNHTPVLVPINAAHNGIDAAAGWRVVARLVGVVRDVDGVERSWFFGKGLRRRHFDP